MNEHSTKDFASAAGRLFAQEGSRLLLPNESGTVRRNRRRRGLYPSVLGTILRRFASRRRRAVRAAESVYAAIDIIESRLLLSTITTPAEPIQDLADPVVIQTGTAVSVDQSHVFLALGPEGPVELQSFQPGTDRQGYLIDQKSGLPLLRAGFEMAGQTPTQPGGWTTSEPLLDNGKPAGRLTLLQNMDALRPYITNGALLRLDAETGNGRYYSDTLEVGRLGSTHFVNDLIARLQRMLGADGVVRFHPDTGVLTVAGNGGEQIRVLISVDYGTGPLVRVISITDRSVGTRAATQERFQDVRDPLIRIPIGANVPGQATTEIHIEGQLGAAASTSPRRRIVVSRPLTVGGSPAHATSLLNNLDTSATPYRAGDRLLFSGTQPDGMQIVSALNLDYSTSIMDVINHLQRVLGDGASVRFVDSAIRLEARRYGPSSLSMRIEDEIVNVGFSNSDFSGVFAEVERGRNATVVGGSLPVFDIRGHEATLWYQLQKRIDGSWTATFGGDFEFLDALVQDIRFAEDGSFTGVFGAGIGDANISFVVPGSNAIQTVNIQLSRSGEMNGLAEIGNHGSILLHYNGRGPGRFVQYFVEPDGTVQGVATNGAKFPLSQLAIYVNGSDGLAEVLAHQRPARQADVDFVIPSSKPPRLRMGADAESRFSSGYAVVTQAEQGPVLPTTFHPELDELVTLPGSATSTIQLRGQLGAVPVPETHRVIASQTFSTSRRTATLRTLLNDLDTNLAHYRTGDRLLLSGKNSAGELITDFIFVDETSTIETLLNSIQELLNPEVVVEFVESAIQVRAAAAGPSFLELRIEDDVTNQGFSNADFSQPFRVKADGSHATTIRRTIPIYDADGVLQLLDLRLIRQLDRSWTLVAGPAEGGFDRPATITGIRFDADGSFVGVSTGSDGPQNLLKLRLSEADTQTIGVDFGPLGNADKLAEFGRAEHFSARANGQGTVRFYAAKPESSAGIQMRDDNADLIPAVALESVSPEPIKRETADAVAAPAPAPGSGTGPALDRTLDHQAITDTQLLSAILPPRQNSADVFGLLSLRTGRRFNAIAVAQRQSNALRYVQPSRPHSDNQLREHWLPLFDSERLRVPHFITHSNPASHTPADDISSRQTASGQTASQQPADPESILPISHSSENPPDHSITEDSDKSKRLADPQPHDR